MRIGITGDNHIQFIRHAGPLDSLMDAVMTNDVDVFCVLGDMGEGMRTGIGGPDARYSKLLGTHPTTVYVMGNHDLFRDRDTRKSPEKVLIEHRHMLYPDSAYALEPAIDDRTTVFRYQEHTVFVGTIGFPDFMHPYLPHTDSYYVDPTHAQTIDPDYILLSDWCGSTDKINASFLRRLRRAIGAPDPHDPVRDIIILSHYPFLPAHSREDPNDRVWPYFYNWHMGAMVMAYAAMNPSLRFWCFAAHSHQYCAGKWAQPAQNVFAFGLSTTYYAQTLMTFDTECTSLDELLDTHVVREYKENQFKPDK